MRHQDLKGRRKLLSGLVFFSNASIPGLNKKPFFVPSWLRVRIRFGRCLQDLTREEVCHRVRRGHREKINKEEDMFRFKTFKRFSLFSVTSVAKKSFAIPGLNKKPFFVSSCLRVRIRFGRCLQDLTREYVCHRVHRGHREKISKEEDMFRFKTFKRFSLFSVTSVAKKLSHSRLKQKALLHAFVASCER